MLICPYCGADDLIEGVDECEHCLQPLTDVFIRVPASSIEADLLRDRVGDLPTREWVAVGPEATVHESMQKMVDKGVGCVLVCEGESLLGIFTERDVLMRIGSDGAKLLDSPVTGFMTVEPTSLSVKDKIAFALHKMDLGGYRHLPVLDGDRVANLISIRGILQYLTDHRR